MAALYQLAQEPEKYIAPLREEVRTVFAGAPDGQVTKQMIAKLEKMDSFLTETGRVFPFGLGTRTFSWSTITNNGFFW